MRYRIAFEEAMNLFRFGPCQACESFWGVHGICSFCQKELSFAYDPLNQRQVRGHDVHSLFLWAQDQHPVLNKLMLMQKGDDPQFQAESWADIFMQRSVFPRLEVLHLAGAKIVCPPSKNGRPDHAYRMARQFAEKLDLEFVPDALRPVEMQSPVASQKDLDRQGREQIRFKAAEKNSLSDNTVFVDDVLTTGSTAHAAYIALGKPSRFRIFVWAYRPLIAVSCRKW